MFNLNEIPAERAMPSANLLARQRLIDQFTKSPSGRKRIPRMTMRAAAIVASTSVLLSGGTALAYVAFKPATVPVTDQTRCYTKASLEGGDDDFYGTTAGQALPAEGGSRKAVAAVELCSALWRQGLLQSGSKQVGMPAEERNDYPVPLLSACTLDNGIAAVFPGDENVCVRLGLPQLAE